jgi:hypothetical protein
MRRGKILAASANGACSSMASVRIKLNLISARPQTAPAVRSRMARQNVASRGEREQEQGVLAAREAEERGWPAVRSEISAKP